MWILDNNTRIRARASQDPMLLNSLWRSLLEMNELEDGMGAIWIPNNNIALWRHPVLFIIEFSWSYANIHPGLLILG